MIRQSEPPDRESRLNQVLAEYLDAADGHPVDPATLVAEHPDLAGEIREFLHSDRLVSELTAPLRQELSRHESAAPFPRSFGAYELLGLLGRGGMGMVYRARQKSPERLVAIKVIHPAYRSEASDVQRFRNEAESAAQLDHPHIVPIHEVGECDGQLFFTMRLIDGGSLSRLPGGPLPPRESARLVSTLARAVQYAHERGILHRDIKPSNILLDSAGRPYVADFGLAKQLHVDSDLTQTGAMIGTPAYMAPEQMSPPQPPSASGLPRRARATTAVDIYGLGAVLYWLLAGQPPFHGESPLEILACVAEREAAPPGRLNPRVDRDLDAICLKCLEKEPARRFASAAELADDLDRWLSGQPTVARPVGPWTRLFRWCCRNPVLAAMSIAIAWLLVFGAAALGWGLVTVHRARQTAAHHQRLAESRSEQLRQREYALDMGNAIELWRSGRPTELSAVLARYLPRAGQADLRGFEWYWLRSLKHSIHHEQIQRLEHGHIVYAAAFSPDGRTIASGGADCRVRLWDAQTGACLAVCEPAHFGDVNCVDFSPDGRNLASCGDDGVIRLWDVAARRQTATLPHANGVVESVRFAHDGRTVASTGKDGVVRLWSVERRELVHSWSSHQPTAVYRSAWMAGAEMVAFSPDGGLLASAGHDGFIGLHNPRTGAAIGRFSGGGSVLAVAVAPDGQTLAAGTREGNVCVLKLDGAQVWRGSEHTSAVRDVRFTRDPEGIVRILSCGDDGTVRSWDAATGNQRDQLVNGQRQLWRLDFSPDGRTLLTAGSDHTVTLWGRAAMANQQLLPLEQAPGDIALCVHFAPDGRHLAVGNRSGKITFWDLQRNQLAAVVETGGQQVFKLLFSPDGRQLAACALGHEFTAWPINEKGLPAQAEGAPVKSVFSSWALLDRQRAIAAADDGMAEIDWSSGKEIRRLPVPAGYAGPLNGWTLSATPNGTLAAIGTAQGQVFLHDLARDTWRVVAALPGRGIGRTVLSPDGRHLATSASDRSLQIWNLHEWRETALIAAGDQLGPLAFSADGRTLALGTAADEILLFQVATGLKMYSLRHPGHLVDLAFSPDGQVLAAAGCNDTTGTPLVALWTIDTASGSE